MRVLVRLPNWVGDMVMSIGFLQALTQEYPDAHIDVIAKKGIDALLPYFPVYGSSFVFSKDEYPGLSGAWKFGRMIRKTNRYDLYFSLPDSFSSAVIGYASGAKQRIGYRKEFRSLLLSHHYKRRPGIHRVDEYTDLLRRFCNKEMMTLPISFIHPPVLKKDVIVININSEAISRRLPLQKAVSIIKNVHDNSPYDLLFIGGKADTTYTDEVISQLSTSDRIINLTGKTSLSELVEHLSSARVVLSTDSGPAHVSNALGVPTVVLFGAGNERNTSPYNKENLYIIRYGQLTCEPCVKNTCALYGIPKCLEMLDERLIVQSIIAASSQSNAKV